MPDEQWYALESGTARRRWPVALVWRHGVIGWAPPQDVAELEGWDADEPAPHRFEAAFRAVARASSRLIRTDRVPFREPTSHRP